MSTRCLEFITRLNLLELQERHEYAFSECDGPKMPIMTEWSWRDETGSVTFRAPQLHNDFPNDATQELSACIGQCLPLIGVYFTKCAWNWHMHWHVHLSETASGTRGRPLPRASLGLDLITSWDEIRHAVCGASIFAGRSKQLAYAVQPYSKRACLAINSFNPVPIIQQIDRLKLF